MCFMPDIISDSLLLAKTQTPKYKLNSSHSLLLRIYGSHKMLRKWYPVGLTLKLGCGTLILPFFFNNTKTCVLFASVLCCLMQNIILRIIKIVKQLLQNMVFSFLTIRLQKPVCQRCGLSFEITPNLLHRYTEDISHPSLPQQPLYTYAMFELYNRIC